MKITKYIQSCLLIEVSDKRILVDPGNIGISSSLVNKSWTNIDIILITHKHADHIDLNSVNKIAKRDNATVYTSSEVLDTYPMLKCNTVKAGDVLDFNNLKIEVVKAVHGYLAPMGDNEVKENIGFIIDDNNIRLYITSDTISFRNDYQCDIICMPFNGNGITLGIFDGCLFAKATNAKLVIPLHFEHPTFKVDRNKLVEAFKNSNLNYKILEINESIEI